MSKSIKEKYIGSAFIMLTAAAVVKIIGAVYKIPLTSYIGATGRGYFSIAYNLCLPIHALTMGAFPTALSKLVGQYNAVGDENRVFALKKASEKLFFIAGLIGFAVMIFSSKAYCSCIASSPKSIYTVLALAPSVFLCCLSASERAYAEGFLDMKPTAVCQIAEAVMKMIFGLLFARFAMSCLLAEYENNSTILGIYYSNQSDALDAVYPLTSAASAAAVSLGGLASLLYSKAYVRSKYPRKRTDKKISKQMYNELLSFSLPLIMSTAVQSIAAFLNNASIQYALSFCSEKVLCSEYNYNGDDICTYVYGVYSSVSDFRNLIPGVIMALGVTAVPAISAVSEKSVQKLSIMINSVIKYTSVLSCFGGVVIALLGGEMLSVFYTASNSDIVSNGTQLLFYMGISVLPCCVASSCVFCAQSLGLSKNMVLPFALSGILKAVINMMIISRNDINIAGAVISDFFGYLLIFVWALAVIKKKYNVKININDAFIKPVICALMAYYASKAVKSALFDSFSAVFILPMCATFCAVLFIILIFLFKCIKISDIFISK